MLTPVPTDPRRPKKQTGSLTQRALLFLIEHREPPPRGPRRLEGGGRWGDAEFTLELIVIPRLHDTSMASAWKGRLYLYRSVFERLAPESIPGVESAVAPNRLGQGTVVPQVDTALLSALTVAYEEAATTS